MPAYIEFVDRENPLQNMTQDEVDWVNEKLEMIKTESLKQFGIEIEGELLLWVFKVLLTKTPSVSDWIFQKSLEELRKMGITPAWER